MTFLLHYFQNFVRAQIIKDLTESKNVFAEVFQITILLIQKNWGARCTLNYFLAVQVECIKYCIFQDWFLMMPFVDTLRILTFTINKWTISQSLDFCAFLISCDINDPDVQDLTSNRCCVFFFLSLLHKIHSIWKKKKNTCFWS